MYTRQGRRSDWIKEWDEGNGIGVDEWGLRRRTVHINNLLVCGDLPPTEVSASSTASVGFLLKVNCATPTWKSSKTERKKLFT